jgi:hypothetical protein
MKPTGAANLGDLGLKTGRTGLAQETPTVSKFVENRDFLGAMTLLEVCRFILIFILFRYK